MDNTFFLKKEYLSQFRCWLVEIQNSIIKLIATEAKREWKLVEIKRWLRFICIFYTYLFIPFMVYFYLVFAFESSMFQDK